MILRRPTPKTIEFAIVAAPPRATEFVVPKGAIFFGPETERPFVTEVPHVELVRDEEPRRGWVGDVTGAVRGIFRDAGAKVFQDDDLVACRGERRIT